ncbi:MAG: hypothetical protein ABW046_05825 [Actinoplanes sp.]
MDPRLAAAVRENAEWCDLYCRAHRLPVSSDAKLWHTARRSPPYYPDAVTLDPATTEADVLGPIDSGPGCSVKDSFATLDLTPYGFRVLFEATWIHRPAGPPGTGETWRRTAASDMPDDRSVTVFAGAEGRVVAHRSGDVIGLSNLAGDAWGPAVAAIAAAFPGMPIVGYEQAEDLPGAYAVGFVPLGPLRVWLRPE